MRLRHPRLLFLLYTVATAAVFLYLGVQIAPPRPPAVGNPDSEALDVLIHQIATDTVYAQNNDCGGLATIAVQRLQAAGFSARRINIVTFEARNGSTDGHILAEVFNPRTAMWEVFDPSSDRRYSQTGWSFVQGRFAFTQLTTDRIVTPEFVDTLHVFADVETFYDRVGQAIAIESDGYFWFGDSAHRALIERYGYIYDPAFLTRFYQ
jgi:hypothetical protein